MCVHVRTCIHVHCYIVQVGTFNELVDLTGEAGEDDGYKAMTALGILSALQSLVKATFNEPQVCTW